MKMIWLALLTVMLAACSTLNRGPQAVLPPVLLAPMLPPVDMPIERRAAQFISVFNGTTKLDTYVEDSFLVAVPPAEFARFTASIAAQQGKALNIVSTEKKSPTSALVFVQFERAIGVIDLHISEASPNKVDGLRLVKTIVSGDGFEKISAEFTALPGRAGYVVEKLNDNGRNELVAAHNAGEQFAIGSTFKLYILAELAAQINAGQRKWSDVVPLSQRSFSSTATGKWPKDSPATLQTLALQMISVSDNSAADTLLYTLGRANVERKLALIGHSAPDKMLPFLSTVEAFALKSPANAELRDRYLKSTEAQQRVIIEQERGRLGFDNVDDRTFAKGPAYIDSLEWFASPYDISKLLDHIRRARNEQMLQILAVNPGIGQEASNWNYAGYKGGSEPGVMSMSLLLQSKSGQWYSVSSSWNNTTSTVDEAKFVSLMTRLVEAIK